MKTIVKKINIKNLAISVILALAAIIFFIVSSALTGVILLLISGLLLMFGLTQEVYAPSNKPIRRYTYYFDKEKIQTLEKILREGPDQHPEPFPFNKYGSGKLDILITSNKEFISLKLFKFVPHKYEEASDFIEHTGKEAKQLCRFLSV